MPLRPAVPVPVTGVLPLCVGDDLVRELLYALPRPIRPIPPTTAAS